MHTNEIKMERKKIALDPQPNQAVPEDYLGNKKAIMCFWARIYVEC